MRSDEWGVGKKEKSKEQRVGFLFVVLSWGSRLTFGQKFIIPHS